MFVKRYETIILSVVPAILLYFAFSKFNLWFLAFPALFILSFIRNFKYWFLCGFTFFFLSLLWLRIAMIDYGGVFPLIAYFLIALLSAILVFLQFGISWLLWKFSSFNLFLLPFFWVVAEILRSHFPYGGFPWFLIGEMLIDFPLLKYYLTAGGVYLGSLIGWYLAILPRFLINFKIIAVVVIFVLPLFFLNTSYKNVPSLKIAVIQPAVPEEIKLRKEEFYKLLPQYWKLIERAIEKNPDIILLPESAFPFTASYLYSEGKKLLKYSEKALVITGLIDIRYGKEGLQPYNSVFLLHKGRVVDFYDKVKLLPFGEYVPFPFGFTKEIFGAIGGIDYVPGDDIKCMKVGDLHLATPICFEISYFSFIKKAARCADLLVVVTNDAWFRDSDGTFQHLRQAQLRALENRMYVVWVNNTGPSAVISPEGKILKKIPYGKREFLIYSF